MAPRPHETTSDITSIKSARAVDISGGNVELTSPSRGIYVGGAGNIAVQFANDPDAGSVILVGIAPGIWHPMQVSKILQTGTTATGIFAGI